jgi:hypothetical protein
MNKFNSTIPIYKGTCPVCIEQNNDYSEKVLATKNGTCAYHYNKARKLRQYLNNQPKKTSKGLFNPKKGENKKECFEESLAKWYEEKMMALDRNPYCVECLLNGKQTFIPLPFRLHAIAHIFPKAQFPSVKTHPLNYLFLATSCGHHDKSHRLDTFSKMKIWPTAVERFLIFKDQIKEHHKYLDEFIRYATANS